MKVLITGGAGFIGSHLTDVHLERGDEVTVLDDLSTGNEENIAHHKENANLNFVKGSILNADTVAEVADGVERIYHLAAAVGVKYIIENPLHSLKVNLIGTERILEQANKTKTPLFIASTSEVYGKTEKIPFAEDDNRVLGSTRVSRWGYSNAKATDEFFALAYHREENLPVLIGRFFNTVGPRQSSRYGMVVPRFVQAAVDGRALEVHGTGNQTRCFLDVTDVIRFLLSLFEKPENIGRVFNLGSQERISINDLAEKVIKITGSKSEIKHLAYEEVYEEGFEDMFHRAPDMTRFESATGLTPNHNLDSIIKRVAEHYRNGKENG